MHISACASPQTVAQALQCDQVRKATLTEAQRKLVVALTTDSPAIKYGSNLMIWSPAIATFVHTTASPGSQSFFSILFLQQQPTFKSTAVVPMLPVPHANIRGVSPFTFSTSTQQPCWICDCVMSEE